MDNFSLESKNPDKSRNFGRDTHLRAKSEFFLSACNLKSSVIGWSTVFCPDKLRDKNIIFKNWKHIEFVKITD